MYHYTIAARGTIILRCGVAVWSLLTISGLLRRRFAECLRLLRDALNIILLQHGHEQASATGIMEPSNLPRYDTFTRDSLRGAQQIEVIL